MTSVLGKSTSISRTRRRRLVAVVATAAATVSAVAGTGSAGSTTASPPDRASASSEPSFGCERGDQRGFSNRLLQQRLDKALATRDLARKGAAADAQAQVQARTFTYSSSRAPSYRSQIDQGMQIWNSRVGDRVQYVRSTSGSADLRFSEGSAGGSYYSGYGRGGGYIFLDPGTSCTNPSPTVSRSARCRRCGATTASRPVCGRWSELPESLGGPGRTTGYGGSAGARLGGVRCASSRLPCGSAH